MHACEQCKFYKAEEPTEVKKSHTIVGRCRRSAPVAGVGYPYVYPDDWCGEWKPDENKL